MSPLASLHVVLSYILQLKATKHFSIVKARIIQDGTVIYGLWCCCLFQYGGVLMLVLLLLVGGSVMGFMLKGKVSLVGSIESRGTMVRGVSSESFGDTITPVLSESCVICFTL